MSKTYDKMEWDFIEEVFKNMNFPVVIVELVMRCISSVSYSVLINGKPCFIFTPQRGLRQGDPLSPYIFILCFSCLLEREKELNLIDGIKIARSAPPITHLFVFLLMTA